jgi:S1-C subfamily serine protease
MENNNVFTLLSDGIAHAVETGAAGTVLVNSRRRFPASGVVYQANLVLTADHVVENDDDIVILGPDHQQYKAALVGRDPGSDLALLKLEGSALSAVQVSKKDPQIGQLALALGRPSPEGPQVSLGVISSMGGPVRNGRGGLLEKYLQAEVNPLPGFSGGPLIDTEGLVLGINTSGIAGGILLTIPVPIAWVVAETLAVHGRIQHGYIGIRSQPVKIPESAQDALGRKQDTGLLLVGLEEDGPSIKAGLMVGDILVAVNSNPVTDPDELWMQLSGNSVGKNIPVEVLRGGQKKVIMVLVAERK